MQVAARALGMLGMLVVLVAWSYAAVPQAPFAFSEQFGTACMGHFTEIEYKEPLGMWHRHPCQGVAQGRGKSLQK